MINTVKIQGEGYLVNGSMSVPKVDGNTEYEEIKILLQGYRDTKVANGFDENGEVVWVITRETFTPLVPEPEFTDAELLQQVEDAKPKVVTMRQARLALLQSNLLVTVTDAITNGTDEALKIEWEYATDVRREWASLITLSTSLGLTSTDLDNLFQLASTL